jgi:pyruvate kinase
MDNLEQPPATLEQEFERDDLARFLDSFEYVALNNKINYQAIIIFTHNGQAQIRARDTTPQQVVAALREYANHLESMIK